MILVDSCLKRHKMDVPAWNASKLDENTHFIVFSLNFRVIWVWTHDFGGFLSENARFVLSSLNFRVIWVWTHDFGGFLSEKTQNGCSCMKCIEIRWKRSFCTVFSEFQGNWVWTHDFGGFLSEKTQHGCSCMECIEIRWKRSFYSVILWISG